MKLNIDKIEEICKKYGYYRKSEMDDEFINWTYPGINGNDYALRYDFVSIYCAVDVRDTIFLSDELHAATLFLVIP